MGELLTTKINVVSMRPFANSYLIWNLIALCWRWLPSLDYVTSQVREHRHYGETVQEPGHRTRREGTRRSPRRGTSIFWPVSRSVSYGHKSAEAESWELV